MKAQDHPLQAQRLQSLYSYRVLDSPREKDFDDIVAFASKICETDISVVNLIDVDRQWFKAETGLGVRETPLATSICAHAILEQDFVEIGDTLLDPRMADNPLCQADGGLRFYAGALLVGADGLPIGTLCVLDSAPKTLTPLQRDALKVLARQVMAQLELRKALRVANVLRQEVDHRVKNSLQSISSLARLQLRTLAAPEAINAVTSIKNRIDAVSTLHEILYKADTDDRVDLRSYIDMMCDHLRQFAPPGVSLDVTANAASVSPRQAVSVGTLVNEFVSNSFKHAFPADMPGTVSVALTAFGGGVLRVTCRDTGIGLSPALIEHSNGLGIKIAKVACAELGTEIDFPAVASGFAAEFEFKSDDVPPAG